VGIRRSTIKTGSRAWIVGVEGACRREVQEETGGNLEPLILVQLYSDPARDPRVSAGLFKSARDPRGRTVSIAYATILHATSNPKQADRSPLSQ
jgi:ADP-ribose pyrophosphatase YjhB (NUDIX family)